MYKIVYFLVSSTHAPLTIYHSSTILHHTMGKQHTVKETKVFYLTMLSTDKIICCQ